jgi:hypothetical protein
VSWVQGKHAHTNLVDRTGDVSPSTWCRPAPESDSTSPVLDTDDTAPAAPLTVSISERDLDLVRAATGYSSDGDEVHASFEDDEDAEAR